MMWIQWRLCGIILAVTLVDAIAFGVLSVREGWSIPAFGRKYQFSCQDCHVGTAATLNEFGQQFMDQGYQLPANHHRVAEASREEPEPPAALFERYCEACHGAKGKGDGPMGQVLIPPAADLTSQSLQTKSDDELVRSIREGVPGTGMPPFKRRWTEQTLRSVLAYVRSLQE